MACYEESLAYARNRVMFDRPIAAFQIQQVRLADMVTEIVKAQLVSLHLGRLKDAGTFTPQQVSLAKRNNVDMATNIAREARRLLGANGILAEYASMRHMANLESVYTYEGTHDVHSLVLGQAVTGHQHFGEAGPASSPRIPANARVRRCLRHRPRLAATTLRPSRAVAMRETR
jgi:glutaryl-CoA dehydrogenase